MRALIFCSLSKCPEDMAAQAARYRHHAAHPRGGLAARYAADVTRWRAGLAQYA